MLKSDIYCNKSYIIKIDTNLYLIKCIGNKLHQILCITILYTKQHIKKGKWWVYIHMFMYRNIYINCQLKSYKLI